MSVRWCIALDRYRLQKDPYLNEPPMPIGIPLPAPVADSAGTSACPLSVTAFPPAFYDSPCAA